MSLMTRSVGPRPAGTGRRGWTLVELVASMAVTLVITAAIASTVLVAQRALPDATTPAQNPLTGLAVDQLAAELQYAVTLVNHSATAIGFTVADRNGDGVPETIRYEWAGTSGAPLTRSYNGSTPVTVVNGVQQFQLTYHQEVTTAQVTPEADGAETLLMSHTTTTTAHDFSIKSSQWYGEYIQPSLPVDAIRWRVTRVGFSAKKSGGTNGQWSVQLQSPTAGYVPSGVVLEEHACIESTLLDYYLTQQVTFSSVNDLSPSQGLCLVFKWLADATACQVRGDDDLWSSEVSMDRYLVKSTDQGGSWSSYTDQSLDFSVYGTVTTWGASQVQSSTRLARVDIVLRAGPEDQSTLVTGTPLLNRPEVAP